MDYWAVRSEERNRGLGSAVYRKGLQRMTELYPKWKCLYAEVRSADANDTYFDPTTRQRLFAALGFQQVLMPHTVLKFSEDFAPPSAYVLTVLLRWPPGGGAAQQYPLEMYRMFIEEFVVGCYHLHTSAAVADGMRFFERNWNMATAAASMVNLKRELPWMEVTTINGGEAPLRQ